LPSYAGGTSKQLDLLTALSDIPTPVWVALSGGISGVGTWIVSMRQIAVSIERARLKNNAEMLAGESAERAAFRAALMTDISDLRALMKECEADRDLLRTRVNAAEEQILVLKASNEIMERWLAFFKDRNAMDVRMASETNQTEKLP
jgi:hypothetical protein